MKVQYMIIKSMSAVLVYSHILCCREVYSWSDRLDTEEVFSREDVYEHASHVFEEDMDAGGPYIPEMDCNYDISHRR